MDLKDIIKLIQLRWTTVLAVAGLVFAILSLNRLLAAPRYVTVTTQLFRVPKYDVSAATDPRTQSVSRLSILKERIQMLQSDEVFEATCEALSKEGVQIDPAGLAAALEVRGTGSSDGTYHIAVTHDDEATSKKILDTLINVFLLVEVNTMLQEYHKERENLQVTIEVQRKQLEEERRQLSETIREELTERGIYDPDIQGQIKASMLTDTERSRQQAMARMKRIEYDLRKLPPDIAPPARDPMAVPLPSEARSDEAFYPQVASAPPVTPATQRIKDLQRRLKDASQRYTEEHPDIIAMADEIKALKETAVEEAHEASARKREEYLLEMEYLQDLMRFLIQVAQDEYTAISVLSERRGIFQAIRDRVSSVQARLLENEGRLATVERNLKMRTDERATTLIEMKKPATHKVAPERVIPLSMLVMISLLCGGITAFVRHNLDYILRDALAVKRYLNLPILASIPNTGKGSPNLLNLAPRTPLWDTFHYLGAALRKTQSDPNHRVILICSAEPNAGKSFVAANLAIAMATERRSVLLIDADLRKSVLHETFSVDNTVGFSTYLTGRLRVALQLDQIAQMRPPAPPPPEGGPPELPVETILGQGLKPGDLRAMDEIRSRELPPGAPRGSTMDEETEHLTQGLTVCLYPTSVPNLTLLPSGPYPVNPPTLLDSPEGHAVLRYARARYDFTIIDTPPILSAVDALMMAPYSDGILMVVSCANTRRDAASAAKQMLDNTQAKILGVALNQSAQEPSLYYYYYHDSYKSTRSSV